MGQRDVVFGAIGVPFARSTLRLTQKHFLGTHVKLFFKWKKSVLNFLCAKRSILYESDAKTQASPKRKVVQDFNSSFFFSVKRPIFSSPFLPLAGDRHEGEETIHLANISFHYLFYHAICQLIRFKWTPLHSLTLLPYCQKIQKFSKRWKSGD